MATFSTDVAVEPSYIEIIDIAAGYGIFSTPVDGLFPGDYVQTATLVITAAGSDVPVISKAVDMSQRVDGFFEYTTQESIDAHFTITAADVATLEGGSFVYSAALIIVRNGVTLTREYQGGTIAVRPSVPRPPLLVNSITLSGGPITGIPGAQSQLTATLRDGYGNVITGFVVTWASTNPSVAAVDATGLVSLATPGAVTISATCQALTATTTATVSTAPFNPSDGDVMFYNAGAVAWQPHQPTADRIRPGTFGGNSAYHFPNGLVVDAGGFTVTSGTSAHQALTATTGLFSSTLTASVGLVVSSGGVTVTGASTISGTLGGITTLSATTVSATNLGGTLTTAAQPNVTGVGILASPHMTGAVVDSGGFTVTSGTSSLQAVTATTLAVAPGVNGTTVATFTGSYAGSGSVILSAWQRVGGAVAAAIGYDDAATVITFGTTTNHGLRVRTNGVTAVSYDTAQNAIFSNSVTVSTGGLVVTTGGLGVSSGTTSLQALTATTVTFSDVVGIGTAAIARQSLRVGGTATSSGGLGASAIAGVTTLVAQANGDTLATFSAVPTFTPGVLTGLVAKGVSVSAFSVAGFTSPGDPVGYDLGVITATGATNAFGIRIAPPTGATTNYLISHTTPSVFSVTASGSLTATTVNATAGVTVGATANYGWTGRASLTSPADAIVLLSNNAGTSFTRLLFGGVTNLFPALRLDGGTALAVCLADNSAYAPFAAAGITATNGLTVTNGTSAVQALTATTGLFSSLLTTVASASGTAGLRLPHGAAPTSPVDGDLWTTTVGLFVRINGVTVGPLS